MDGSNGATDFNDVSDINVSGNMILLYTFTHSGNWMPRLGYIVLTTLYSFRYYLLLANNYGGYCNITNLSIQHGKMEVSSMALITLYQHQALMVHLL